MADDLDRLLEKAGNAGDLEAEAICIVAREIRANTALLTAMAHDLDKVIARLPSVDFIATIERLRAEVAALRVVPQSSGKTQRKEA